MSNSPRAQHGHGSGSGRRTTPATRSPGRRSLPGGARRTRPSDSCPSTRRSDPGGGAPCSPARISWSVPHTPSASISTSSSPSLGCGSGSVVSSARRGGPDVTVMASTLAQLGRGLPSGKVSAQGSPRVVVVGGGFAGLQVVRALRGAPVEVTLVDRNNYPLFQPLSYQVATGALSPAEIAEPLR